MNNADPRVIKTKKLFKDAFKQLVVEYDDYINISIRELCDRANLNRRTFYLHYKQIDDILVELQEEAIHDFYHRIKELDIIKDVEGVVRAFFDMNESNPVYQKMNSADAYFYAKEITRKRALIMFKEKELLGPALHLDSVTQSYIFRHYHMSVSFMYSDWIRSNRAVPKEKMIRIITDLLQNGITSFINKNA